MKNTVFSCMNNYQYATIAWCEALKNDNTVTKEYYDKALGLYRHELVEALLRSDHMANLPPMTEEGANRVVDHFSDWIVEQFQAGIMTTVGDYVVVM
jgi:hypothetical protein